MTSLGPKPSLRFKLAPVEAPMLQEDGLSVVSVDVARGQIESLSELVNLFSLANSQTIMLIPRRIISEKYLERIRTDITDDKKPTPEQWHSRWNLIGGLSPKNAIPHTHCHRNCHASPDPSSCPTLFFSRKSVIGAVEEVAANRHYSIYLRTQLSNSLSFIPNNPHLFFESFETLSPAPSGSAVEVLECIKEIQAKAEVKGGVFSVSLDKNSYGIIAIPALSLHGRSVLDHFSRGSRTGWRYFGPRIETSQQSLDRSNKK